MQTMIEKFELDQMGYGEKYEKISAEHEKLKQLNLHQVKDSTALRSECNTMKHKMSDMENKLHTLQAENSNLNSKVKDQSSVKMSDYKNVQEQLTLEKENMKIMEKKLSGEVKTLKDIMEKKEREVDKIQTESKSKEDKLACMLKAITVEVQNLKDANNRKSAQDTQSKAKLDVEIGELKNNLGKKEQENTQMQKDLKFLRDSLTNANTLSESLKGDLKNKEAVLAQQKECADKLQKDLDAQVIELTAQKVQLEQRIKNTMSELDNLKDLGKNIQASLGKKERELQDHQAEMKNIERDNDTLEKKVIGLEKTRDSLASTLGLLKQETEKQMNMNGSFKQEIQDLKNILDGKDRELSQIQSELSHKGDELMETHSQLESIKQTLKLSEQTIIQFKNDAEGDKLGFQEEQKKLKDEISKFEKQNSSLNADLSKLCSEKNEICDRLEQKTMISQDCQNEMELLQVAKKAADEQLTIIESEKSELENKFDKSTSELIEIKNSNCEMDKSLEATRFSLESAESRILNLEQKLNESELAKCNVSDNLSTVTKEKENVEMLNQKYVEDVITLKQHIEDETAQNVAEQNKIIELNHILQNLKDELSSKDMTEKELTVKLDSEADSFRNEIAEKERNIEELKSETCHISCQLEKCQETVQNLESSNADLETDMKALETKVEEANFIVSETKVAEEKQISNALMLEESIIMLKDSLNQGDLYISELTAKTNNEIEELTNTCERNDTEIVSLKEEVAKAHIEIEKQQKNYDEASFRVADLEATLSKLEMDFENASFSTNLLTAENGELNSKIQQVEAESIKYKDLISSKELEFIQMNTELKQKVDEMIAMNDGRDSEIEELKKEIEHKSEVLASNFSQLDQVLSEKEDATRNLNLLNTQVDELNFAVDEYKSTEDKYLSEMTQLKSEIVIVKDQLSDQEMNQSVINAKLNQEIKELQNVLECTNIKFKVLEDELEHKIIEVNEKTETIQNVSKMKEGIDLKASGLEKEVEELVFASTEAKHNEEKQRNIIQELNREVQTLKDNMDDQEMQESVKTANLNQEIKEIQIVSEGRESCIKELSDKLDHQFETTDMKIKALENITYEKNEAETKVSCLEKQIEELQFALTEASSTADKHRIKMNELAAEVITLKDQLCDQDMEQSVNSAKKDQEIKELKNVTDGKDSIITELEKELSHKTEDLCAKIEIQERVSKEIGETEAKVHGLLKEVEELQFALTDMKGTEEMQAKSISELCSEIQTLKDTLSEKELEKSTNCAQFNQEVMEYKNIVEGQRLAVEKLEQQSEGLKDKLEHANLTLEQTFSEKDEQIAMCQGLEKNIDELQFSFDESKKSKEMQVIENENLKSEIQSLKDDLSDNAMDESVNTAKLKQKLNDMKNVTEAKETEVESMKIEITHKAADVDRLLLEKQILTDEKTDTETSLQIVKAQTEELEFTISECKSAEEKSQTRISELQQEVDALKDQLRDQALEESVNNAKLKQEMSGKQNAMAGKELEIEQLKLELQHKTERVDEFETRNKGLSQDMGELEARITQLNEEIGGLTFALEESKQAMEQHSKSIFDLNAIQQTLKDDYSKLQLEYSTTKTTLEQENCELRNVVENQVEEIAQVRTELSNVSLIYNKSTEMVDLIRREMEQLKTSESELKQRVEEFQFTTSEAQKEIMDKSENLTILQTEIQSLKDELSDQSVEEAVNKAKVNQELNQLKNVLEGKALELSSLNVEIENNKLLLEEKKTAIDELENANRECRSSIIKFEQGERELENIIEEKEQTLEAARQELSHTCEKLEISENRFTEIRDDKLIVDSVLNNLESDLEASKLNYSEAKTDIELKGANIKELESVIVQLKDKLSDQNVEHVLKETKLNQDIEEHKNMLDGKANEINDMNAEIEHLRDCVHGSTSEFEQVRNMKAELENKVRIYEAELEELKFSSKENISLKEKTDSKVGELEKELCEVKDVLNLQTAKDDAEKVRLSQEAAELNNIVSGKEKEIENLQSELFNTSERLNSAISCLDSVQADTIEAQQKAGLYTMEIDKLEFALSEAEKEKNILSTKNDEQDSEVKSLKDDLNNLQTTETSMNAQINIDKEGSSNVINGLNEEIESLKSALERERGHVETHQGLLNEAVSFKHQLELRVTEIESCADEALFKANEKEKEANKYREQIMNLHSEISALKDALDENSTSSDGQVSELNLKIEEMSNKSECDRDMFKDIEIELAHKISELEKLKELLSSLEYQLVSEKNLKLEVVSNYEACKLEKDQATQQHQSETSSLDDKINTLRDMVEKLEKEITCVEEQFHKKSCQLQVSQEDCEDMQEQIQQMEKRIEKFETENGKLDFSVTGLTDRLTTIDMEKCNLNRILEENQNVIDGKEKEISAMREERDHQDEKIQEYQEQLKKSEHLIIETQVEVSQLQKHQDASQFSLEEGLKNLNEDNAKLEELLHAKEAKIREFEKEVQQYTDILESERSKLVHSDVEIGRFKEETATAFSRISHLEKEKETYIRKIEQLNGVMSDSQSGHISIQTKLDETEFKLETTLNSANNLEEKLNVLEDLNVKNVTVIEDLHSKYATLEAELVMANEIKDSLTHTISVEQSQERELQEQVDKLNSELNNLKDSSNQANADNKLNASKLMAQVQELTNCIESRESELDSLREELSSVKEKLSTAEQDKINIEGEIEEEKVTINQIEHKLDQAMFTINEMTCEMDSLKEIMSFKESELQTMKDSTHKINTDFGDSQARDHMELVQLRNAMVIKESHSQELQQSLEDMSEKMSASQISIEHLEKKVLDRENELFSLRDELSTVKGSSKEKIKCQELDIEKLQDSLTKTQAELREITTAREECVNKVEYLQLEEKNTKHDLEEALSEKERIVQTVTDLEETKSELVIMVDNLRTELRNSKSENDHFEKKLCERENELLSTQVFSQNLQTQLDQVDGSYKTQQEKIYELTTEKDGLESNLQHANIKTEMLQLDLKDKVAEQIYKLEETLEKNKEYQDRMYQLEDEAKKTKQDISELNEENNSLRKEIKTVTHDCGTRKAKLDAAESNLYDLQTTLTEQTAHVSVLEHKIEDVSSELIEERRTMGRKDEENNRLKQDLEDLTSHLNAVNEKSVHRNSEMDELTETVDDLNSEMSRLERDNKRKDESIVSLEDSNNQCQEKIKTLVEELFRSTEKLKQSADIAKYAERDLAEYQVDFSQRSNEMVMLSADLSEAKEQIRTLMDEKEELSAELTNLKQKSESYETEMKTLTLKVSETQSELHGCEQKSRDHAKEIQKQLFEVDKLENKVKTLESEKEELEGIIEYTSLENTGKEDEIASLQHRLQVDEGMSNELQKSFNQTQAEYNQVNVKLRGLEELVYKLQAEKVATEQVIVDKDTSSQATIGEVKSLQKKICSMENDLGTLKDALESFEFENSSLEASAVAMKTEKTVLENNLETMKQLMRELEQKKDEIMIENELRLKKEKENHLDVEHALNSDVKELKEKCSNLSSILEESKKENTLLETKIESMEAGFGDFSSQLTDNSEAKSQLQNMSLQQIELEQKLATQEREKRDLLSQFLNLEDKYGALDRQNATCNNQVSMKKKLLHKFH